MNEKQPRAKKERVKKEKEPREKKEKQSRGSNKRKKQSVSSTTNNKTTRVIIPTAIVLVVIALLFLLKGFGLGFGSGVGGKGAMPAGFGDDGQSVVAENPGEGGSAEGEEIQSTDVETMAQSTDKTEVQTETETESETTVIETETEPEPVVIDICVYHSDYLYNSERIDLVKFVDVIRSTEGEVIVEIMDDAASSDAYEELIKTLTNEHIMFIEK